MQQQVHVTAQKGAKHPKKFRGRPWPSIRTGMDAIEEEDRARLAEANQAFMAMFEIVPEAEWKADMAEHLAAIEAGAEQTPPQRRAIEQAAREASPTVTRGGLGVPTTPQFSDQPA